jgi:hypothetical protein
VSVPVGVPDVKVSVMVASTPPLVINLLVAILLKMGAFAVKVEVVPVPETLV